MKKKMDSFNALCLVSLSAGLLLSGCGGGDAGTGGTPTPTPFQLPFNCSNTAGSIDGCWRSEICATDIGGLYAGTRLVESIDQTAADPNAGDITTWLVHYANAQCSGNAIAATNVNSGGNFTETYEEGTANVCADMAGDPLIGIACTDLDITVTAGSLVSTGYTTYVINDTDTRVCFPFGDYNYDNTGNGGLGLPIENDPINRPTDIDFTALRCMVRFTP